jgi:hypothetical protein
MMRRLKFVLIALTVALPSLAALGFFRMAAEISARPAPMPARASTLEQAALAVWKDDLTLAYVCAVITAVVLGRVRAFVTNSA